MSGKGVTLVEIRPEHAGDVVAREFLLDRCFGENRRLKTSERLREGRRPAEGLAFTAEAQGRLVGTVRVWHVEAGSCRPALLLGPLAVDPDCQGLGLGATLMRHALNRAAVLGHGGVLLVGDASYYARFGFTRTLADALFMPGPFERERLLGLALRPGALDGASGLVRATGVWADSETPERTFDDAQGASRRRVA